ncbi:hypothetical protein CAC42_5425 [Sphaceloma murrayae]|uniref:Transcription factor domain-containing protein n=1 Tax=Sphaceloma murrayae TaxID=2082308 RepID=A0A2K1QUZ1_9PEZI|nr:hypothetical protein CAC42_5425 [Sphaceloma murrayae]
MAAQANQEPPSADRNVDFGTPLDRDHSEDPNRGATSAQGQRSGTDHPDRLVEARVPKSIACSYAPSDGTSPAAAATALNGRRHTSALTPSELASASRDPIAYPAEDGTSAYESVARQQLDDRAKAEILLLYSQRIHCQPLPLLDRDNIRRVVEYCPRHLFTALALAVMPHQVRPPRPLNELRTLAKAARQASIMVDDQNLEAVQAFCFLSWVFISAGDRTASQQMNHMAAILYDEITTRDSSKHTRLKKDDVTRCCQSIFILKSIVVRAGSTFERLLKLPALIAPPDNGPLVSAGGNPPRPKDLGIVSYNVHLFSIFSRAVAFVQSFGMGGSAEHWRAQSIYHSIIEDLHHFETTLSQAHRVRKLGFEQRTSGDLEHRRLYWAPWFMMQFLFHGVQALINHPLLHVVDQRKQASFRPPSFNQHTADQARLHAGWVVHLLKATSEKKFDLYDPFISFIVSTTATVFLFWLFDKDERVADEAATSFRSCLDHLRSRIDRETHLRSTFARLEMLQQSANAAALGRNPRPSAALEVLIPVFEYCRTDPVEQNLHSDMTVPLPVDSNFLTSPNAITNAATPSNGGPGGDYGKTGMATTANHDVDMVNGEDLASFNIFDTSDILNFTLLDGSLWPGQL